MENRTDGIIFNPNLIWLPTPPQMDSAEDFAYVDCQCADSAHRHSKDKETKKVKVDIYFTAVGLFSIPTEKEMQAAMEEIRQNPQHFKFSA